MVWVATASVRWKVIATPGGAPFPAAVTVCGTAVPALGAKPKAPHGRRPYWI